MLCSYHSTKLNSYDIITFIHYNYFHIETFELESVTSAVWLLAFI